MLPCSLMYICCLPTPVPDSPAHLWLSQAVSPPSRERPNCHLDTPSKVLAWSQGWNATIVVWGLEFHSSRATRVACAQLPYQGSSGEMWEWSESMYWLHVWADPSVHKCLWLFSFLTLDDFLYFHKAQFCVGNIRLVILPEDAIVRYCDGKYSAHSSVFSML